jgi:hypothetical protein
MKFVIDVTKNVACADDVRRDLSKFRYVAGTDCIVIGSIVAVLKASVEPARRRARDGFNQKQNQRIQ